MDTVIDITVYDDSELMNNLVQQIYLLDSLLDVTDENSELYQLNESKNASVSPIISDLAYQAKTYSKRTNYAFDPTVYPILQLWGFTTSQFCVPDHDTINNALLSVGSDYIQFEDNRIILNNGSSLDFGGIAKGYTSDYLSTLVEANNSCALLSLGGNIKTIGTKPNGENWNIGIADPINPSQAAGILSFKGSKSIITSGGYQRYFVINGKTYIHIIDPRSGYPVDNEIASVTIVSESGTYGDVLSTALYVMGYNDAITYWKNYQDFDFVIILKDGRILVSEGLSSILHSCNYEVVYS